MPNNRQSILIKDVKIPLRFRKEMGDVTSLAESINRHGLIQPIVLSPDFTLVAGERRLRAHEYLKRESIDYVLIDDVPEQERHEIELEENIRRKQMTWQEEALGVLHIYRVRKRNAALEGWKWGQELAAQSFGIALGTVNYMLVVAKRLEEEQSMPLDKRRIWNFGNVSEAYRLGVMMEHEDAALAEIARMAKRSANTKEQELHLDKVVQEVKEAKLQPTYLELRKKQYESNPLNIEPFEVYWAEKERLANEADKVVWLSSTLLQGDSLKIMMLPGNFKRWDHIITDPPYAIDLDAMNQGNVHGGMVDIDRVEDTHQVEDNMQLLAEYFKAAFYCTKDNAFVVTFCDHTRWQYMYDLAIAAGFAVQRWPMFWRKINQSVMNNCAMYNTTKDYENIMLCRKPGATLATKYNSSFIDGSNAEVTKLTGHPFAKPFEVTRKLVEIVSLPGQVILDPFAGGGSIVIEILRAERKAIAIELETHQFNAMYENVKRIYYLKLNPDFIFK